MRIHEVLWHIIRFYLYFIGSLFSICSSTLSVLSAQETLPMNKERDIFLPLLHFTWRFQKMSPSQQHSKSVLRIAYKEIHAESVSIFQRNHHLQANCLFSKSAIHIGHFCGIHILVIFLTRHIPKSHGRCPERGPLFKRLFRDGCCFFIANIR